MDVTTALQNGSNAALIAVPLIGLLIYAIKQDISVKWVKKQLQPPEDVEEELPGNATIAQKTEWILKQLKPNAGGSLRDQVDKQRKTLSIHGKRQRENTKNIKHVIEHGHVVDEELKKQNIVMARIELRNMEQDDKLNQIGTKIDSSILHDATTLEEAREEVRQQHKAREEIRDKNRQP